MPNIRQIFSSQPNEPYSNYIELVENKFRLYWNITEKAFIGEVHVKTNGWISFGFSSDGSMDESDVFVGWIKNGKHFFKVYYILGNILRRYSNLI